MLKRLILCFVIVCSVFGADGQFTKTPYEAVTLSMDFSARAPNGITLSSVTAINFSSGANDTATIIVASNPTPAVLPGTETVAFRVFGGVGGQTEYIHIQVVRSDTGEQLEGILTLTIVNQR